MADDISIEDLARALRLWRRLFLRFVAICVFGLIAAVVLSVLSNKINPPYGVYIAGNGLGEWALIATLVLLVAELYWDGIKIGRIMHDPLMMILPGLGMLTSVNTIVQKAAAKGMRPDRTLGGLRPIAKKS